MRKIFKNNIFMIKQIYKYCRSQLFVSLINAIFNSFNIIVNIIFMRYIVIVIMEKSNLNKLFFVLGIYLVYQMVYSCINAYLQQVIIPNNFQIIHKGMQIDLFEKAKKIDFECFDEASFLDKYYMAMQQSDSRAIAVLSTISIMIGNIFAIVSLFSFIGYVNTFSIIVILLSVIISLIINSYVSQMQKEYHVEKSSLNRLSNYVTKIFTMKEYERDIKIYSKFSNLLENLFSDTSENILLLIKKYGQKTFSFSCIDNINIIFSNIIITGYFSYKALKSSIDVADFVTLLNASQQLLIKIKDVFQVIPQFYEHSIFIENFKEFMGYQPKIKINENGKKIDEKVSIRFEKVNFKYPNLKENTLNNINFSIEPGQKIAIVGENGAGKTTLIKLLLRLFEPSEGGIYINNIDYKQYCYKSLIDSISIVPQDIHLYAVSIAENILMRKIENAEKDEKLVIKALEYVGLYEKVCLLPDGIYTNLSKEFNSTGVLFSGGEYQRLAIARAYAKDSKIVILDEPSSSLDPIAEQQILETMFKLMTDKTVIIISHRLTNIKKADKIYMIQEGTIVEEGTHDELMLINGEYAYMYKEQAKKYIEEI